MELFNYGIDALSTEKQTYLAIKERIGMSEEEFMNLPYNERKEWIDACRLALVLVESNEKQLHEGYCFTDMYNSVGKFDLGAATEIVRNKKRLLDVIEKNSEIDLTPAQFILMGDVNTYNMASDVMKKVNLETAQEVVGVAVTENND